MEEICSKHSGPPPHTHEQDEALYILEGEITLAAGAEKIVSARRRKDARHTEENEGTI